MAAQRKDPVLARIQLAAKLGVLRTTKHSRERMGERSVTAEDVREAILTSTRVIEQLDEEKRDEDGEPRVQFRLEGGTDIDGEPLKVVVAEEPRGLRLVTVM